MGQTLTQSRQLTQALLSTKGLPCTAAIRITLKINAHNIKTLFLVISYQPVSIVSAQPQIDGAGRRRILKKPGILSSTFLPWVLGLTSSIASQYSGRLKNQVITQK